MVPNIFEILELGRWTQIIENISDNFSFDKNRKFKKT